MLALNKVIAFNKPGLLLVPLGDACAMHTERERGWGPGQAVSQVADYDVD